MRTLASVFVVTWSFRLSGSLTFGTWLAVPVVLLGLSGLLGIVAAWLPSGTLSRRRQRQIDLAVLAAVIAGLAMWSYFQVYSAPDYGTDEIAFDQYAAQLALHGINPYLHSMAAAFPLFHVSPNGYTFMLNGQPVTTLSYPALAFEEYLPLLMLGITTQAAVWTDVAAWALGAAVLYAVLPRRLAPLAAVVVSLDVFTGYAVGGVTDFLFIPLLIGAAAGWDRFAWTRGPAAWRGPILMGLAMSVKQTPWLIVPFVVGGIVLESRRLRDWNAGPPRWPPVPGDRRAGLPATKPALPAEFTSRLAERDPHPHHRPDGAGRPGADQPQPVAPPRRRIPERLYRCGSGRLRRPPGLLPDDVPGAQTGGLPAPVDRAVLRHPFFRQLSGHADPGGGGGRGDHTAPAAPGALAALEMGGRPAPWPPASWPSSPL